MRTETSEENSTKADVAKKLSHEEILQVARDRFKLAEEYESDGRTDEIDDQKFMIGDQWPLEVKNGRLQDQRPCLTINRIPQFVRQITNDQRQNRPSIKINPVDDKADIETAKIFQGMVRHIEYNSHADVAVDTAFDWAASSGLGYFRIITEYADSMSFQQEIKIEPIKDRFSVYMDPYYQKPDGSDANWGFVFEEMSRDEFKAKYPKANATSMSDWESLGDLAHTWLKKDSVRVAEYYYKEYEEVEIVLMSDKTVLRRDHVPKQLPDGVREVSSRISNIPKIKWCKINGLEILEETDVPGEWIPIIPVIGEERIVEGKRVISGIVRHAKDPQRMYNYWKSSQTETIALAPKAPYIGMEGQFEGYEDQWKSANIKNHAFLQYKGKSLNGIPAPPPQRQVYEPPVQAITAAAAEAADDLKSTTGIYDASLGNKSNEQSGIAIQRRSQQSQSSNFHFIDNLSRSLRHAGRILVAWIPKVYDTPQTVRIISDDGTVDMVQVNQIFQEGSEQKAHMLEAGKYDVTVDTGPSFATKRQEAVASMLDLSRAAPQLMQIAGDLMVRNMDWPGAQEIADRIKKTLPPNIVEDDKNKQQQPLPPQVQQQMQQMSQMVQALSKELDENSELIRTKTLELQSHERIAALESETRLKLELIKQHAKDAQIAFQEEMGEIQHLRSTLTAQQNVNNGAGEQPQGEPAVSPQPSPTGGSSPGQPMGETS